MGNSAEWLNIISHRIWGHQTNQLWRWWGDRQHVIKWRRHKENTDSRVADGRADLGLGNVLLQMAEVSASSTSCCQWLRQREKKTTGWGWAAGVRGAVCGGSPLTLSQCVIMSPASSLGQRDTSLLDEACDYEHCMFTVCGIVKKHISKDIQHIFHFLSLCLFWYISL